MIRMRESEKAGETRAREREKRRRPGSMGGGNRESPPISKELSGAWGMRIEKRIRRRDRKRAVVVET